MTVNSDEYISKKLDEKGGFKTLEQRSKDKLREKKEKKESKTKFTQKLKEQLVFFGFWSAIISGIAYLLITIVLIVGISSDTEIEQQITFAVLGVVVGLLINFQLGTQGIMLAQKEPESQIAMKAYRITINKTKSIKQLRSITYYLVVLTIFDFFIKGATVGFATYYSFKIATIGNGNWILILFAIANLGMFTGFGLRRLAKLYDKYIDEHIPTMIAKTEKLNEQEAKEAKEQEDIENKKNEKEKEN